MPRVGNTEQDGETRGLLAKEERLALAVTADLLAAFLSAALLPVYTLKTGTDPLSEALHSAPIGRSVDQRTNTYRVEVLLPVSV